MKKNSAVDFFRTQDISEAAFLSASQIKLLTLELLSETERPGVYFFLFEGRVRCEELITDYYRGSARTDARTFADAMLEVKAILSNKKKGLFNV